MRALQAHLQRWLQQLDPWLDACFPIATSLICLRQRLLAYSLLCLFLLLRLLQGSHKQPWRWVLISLLMLHAGLIVEDRDLKPASSSDYLIMATSFAAGLQRSQEQWRRSLVWISSSILPLLLFSIAAGEAFLTGNAAFIGFNINKLGFLAGLLTVAAYGWSQQRNERKATQQVAGILTLAGIAMCIASQSRAAILVPLIAIGVDQLVQRRHQLKPHLPMLISGTATAILVTALLIYSGDSAGNRANRLSDINRIATLRCWVESTATTTPKLLLGSGYGSPARFQCGPERIPTLHEIHKQRGFQHAHNLYAQVFAESGLVGLLLASGLTAAAGLRAWRLRHQPQQRIALPLVVYVFLMGLGLTYWQVLMLNQVLVGYCLASLSAAAVDPEPASESTPSAPPT
jgi:O-antigen ligase